MMTDWHAVSVWLVIGILGLALSAYEIAGMTVPGLHTISYFGYHHLALKLVIFALFVLGGFVGGLWWLNHASYSVPR